MPLLWGDDVPLHTSRVLRHVRILRRGTRSGGYGEHAPPEGADRGRGPLVTEFQFLVIIALGLGLFGVGFLIGDRIA